jgi:hypothetical protein
MSASTKEQDTSEIEFLTGFVQGTYQLIGKSVDFDSTYVGEIEIYQEKEQLQFKKTIGENVIKGKAKIEKSMADSVKLLRLTFQDKNKNMEQTCLMQSDLDNYARITCHVYAKDNSTKSPGLEAFFIKN